MSSPQKNSMLMTDKTTIRFGGLCAVNELTMDVNKGEIFGLIRTKRGRQDDHLQFADWCLRTDLG